MPSFTIEEGCVSQKKETILIKRRGKTVARIKLGEPTIVAQAEREEIWGFFQFPTIGKTEDGVLIVSWSFADDSYVSYGKDYSGSKISFDGGRTWIAPDSYYFAGGSYSVKLSNGEVLYTLTPASKDIGSYADFPSAVSDTPIEGYTFYKESELPRELKGVYFNRRYKDGSFQEIHGVLKDSCLLRYAINYSMPIVWWGNIKKKADRTIVAGTYPAYYQNAEGKVLSSAVSFYESADDGFNWELVGSIPYQTHGESIMTNVFDGNEGFSEPAFEILRDSTFICVMRTGSTTPMYKSISKDMGKHWSVPVPFTSNGVRPNLLLLRNGVLVLSSGRPGAQIRFSTDGDGEKWTLPIDMLPFAGKRGEYDEMSVGVSCGYTDIIEAGKNSFYIVYSDFKTKNEKGELRKAIMFRKVEIRKR